MLTKDFLSNSYGTNIAALSSEWLQTKNFYFLPSNVSKNALKNAVITEARDVIDDVTKWSQLKWNNKCSQFNQYELFIWGKGFLNI
jgi:hypothetical protein